MYQIGGKGSSEYWRLHTRTENGCGMFAYVGLLFVLSLRAPMWMLYLLTMGDLAWVNVCVDWVSTDNNEQCVRTIFLFATFKDNYWVGISSNKLKLELIPSPPIRWLMAQTLIQVRKFLSSMWLQLLSLHRFKVHYGTGVMSLQLPKQVGNQINSYQCTLSSLVFPEFTHADLFLS